MTRRVRIACSADRVNELIDRLLKSRAATPRVLTEGGSTSEIDVACRCCEGFRNEYLSAWAEVLGEAVDADSYQPEWVVGQIFCATPEEVRGRRHNPSFFRAHVTALDVVLSQITSRLAKHVPKLGAPAREQALKTSSDLMRELAISATELLQWCAAEQDLKVTVRIVPSNICHPLELYRTLLLLWFGPPVADTWLAASAMRQAIEVRIRHAVNVMGVYVDGVLVPVPLLDVLDALSKEGGVETEVPWCVIRSICSWANMYLHTGYREFPWLVGYAIIVLEPLMQGVRQEEGAWSANNAIRLTSAAIDNVGQQIVRDQEQRWPGQQVRIASFPMEPRSQVVLAPPGSDQ